MRFGGEELPDLVGVDDVIERMGVSRATIRRWVHGGRMPEPARFGRLLRWRAEDLAAWIATYFQERTNRNPQTAVTRPMVRGPGRGKVYLTTSKGRRVWCGDWTDARGRRHRQILGGTKEEAERVLAQFIAQRDRERHGIVDNAGLDLRVEEFVELAVREMAIASKPRSVATRRRAVERLLEGIGARLVRDVTPQRVISWCRERYDQGLATSSIRSELRTVRSAMQLLVNTGQLAANPLWGVRPLPKKARRAPHQRRALTEEEIPRLVALARAWDAKTYGTPVAPLAQSMLQCGARYAELRRVRQCDLDVKGRSLRLPWKITKSLRGRVLPLPKELVDVLLELRKFTACALRREPTGEDPIFVTFEGRPLTAHGSMFRTRLRALYVAAGIPLRDEDGRCVDIHALRHTFVTRLERNGASPAVQRTLAGHKSYDLTLDVYTHLVPEDARRAIESLPPVGVGSTVTTAAGDGEVCADAQRPPLLPRQLDLFADG